MRELPELEVLHNLQEYIGKVMALHTRYPGHHNETKIVPGSPFTRVKGIIESVFARCNSTACLPKGGLPMVAFWKADSSPRPVIVSQTQEPVRVGCSAPRYCSAPPTA